MRLSLQIRHVYHRSRPALAENLSKSISSVIDHSLLLFFCPLDVAMYTVSQKNVLPLVCYNFDTRERILILFGRYVGYSKQSKDALLCYLR